MLRRLVPVVAGVFALAGMAWASSGSHSVKVKLDQAMSLGGKALPAGHYTFSWVGDQRPVEVKVEQGGKLVTEAKANVEQSSRKAREQALVFRNTKSGQRVLEQLELEGKTVLVFPTS
jgi:hypothetical protein